MLCGHQFETTAQPAQPNFWSIVYNSIWRCKQYCQPSARQAQQVCIRQHLVINTEVFVQLHTRFHLQSCLHILLECIGLARHGTSSMSGLVNTSLDMATAACSTSRTSMHLSQTMHQVARPSEQLEQVLAPRATRWCLFQVHLRRTSTKWLHAVPTV